MKVIKIGGCKVLPMYLIIRSPAKGRINKEKSCVFKTGRGLASVCLLNSKIFIQQLSGGIGDFAHKQNVSGFSFLD